ncbi:MAG: hypothetical protein ABFS46_22960 [Myxococcota bacterium]
MQLILRFVPGVVGAVSAFAVSKLLARTEIGFDLGAFLLTYLAVSVAVDRGLKGYGRSTR